MEEDLVTYQIALKLKEKGFDIPCEMYYHIHDDIEDSIMSLESTGGWCNFYNSKNRYRCAAPPISLVLKWLREEKRISVEKNVGMHPYKRDACWYCTIVRFSESGVRENLDNFGETCDVFDSYEQAALAGIEYVLNLI